MITLISGTNRENCQTLKVVNVYADLLKSEGEEVQILNLQELPQDFIFSAIYGKQNDKFNELLNQYIFKADKLVVVSPEYNGSFPGILKAFIDGWDPRKLNQQKLALVGVASGRQGNSRGMDHLTGIFNYLGFWVLPFKLPISKVFAVFNEKDELVDDEIKAQLIKQVKLLIN